jgi:hypothetical protein
MGEASALDEVWASVSALSAYLLVWASPLQWVLRLLLLLRLVLLLLSLLARRSVLGLD